ncbi:81b28838-9e5f-4e18-8851-f90517a49573 [Thermothielavioides terrestris]|uniref:81b28838-9e5f-4e18-8851-f90517a49573 n=1 Tax=Thermothielavioides terrestris TaxID=2587410 RepID=A0A446BDN9_9PEZI|nr:81b28838-9e5f-4e18-8851-f90517a49573 [Thermothielavioides terrestris]
MLIGDFNAYHLIG